MHARVRRRAPTLATSCELTHLDRVPIDFARIERQHADYVSTLHATGLDVDATCALAAPAGGRNRRVSAIM